MGSAFQILDIILLAMVAAFIFLRLRSVLGRRTGHEAPPEEKSGRRFEEGDHAGFDDDAPQIPMSKAHTDHTAKLDRASREVLDQIQHIEPGFDLGQFVDGASNAYAMILKAFWAGRLDEVAEFLSPGVYKQFDSAIQARLEQGFELDNELLDVTNIIIASIEMHDRSVAIAIDFHSRIISVIRDASGDIVEGDVAEPNAVIDIWTFSRELGSRDPNWLLSATKTG